MSVGAGMVEVVDVAVVVVLVLVVVVVLEEENLGEVPAGEIVPLEEVTNDVGGPVMEVALGDTDDEVVVLLDDGEDDVVGPWVGVVAALVVVGETDAADVVVDEVVTAVVVLALGEAVVVAAVVVVLALGDAVVLAATLEVLALEVVELELAAGA